MQTIEFILIPLIFIIVPIAATALTSALVLRTKRLLSERKYSLFVVAVVLMLAAWPLSQVYAPLSIVANFIGMFLASYFIVKLPVLKSIIYAATYVVIVLLFQAALIYFLTLAFK